MNIFLSKELKAKVKQRRDEIKTKEAKAELAENKRRFLYYFIGLEKRVNEEQMKKLSAEELTQLADTLVLRVIPMAIIQFCWYLAIPLLGWMMLLWGRRGFFMSLWYLWYRWLLKRRDWENYFPYDALKKGAIWVHPDIEDGPP